MKFIISESKLDNLIFKYLDNQDFIQIEKGNYIYFVNSENDEYCQIKYNIHSNKCTILLDLVEEISSFFSMEKYNSKKVISRWIEKTLNIKVKDFSDESAPGFFYLGLN